MKQPKNKANTYKRSFWGLYKWNIILGAVPIILFIAFSSVLIFYARIFEKFNSTSVTRHDSYGMDAGTLYYEVDGVEYEINYNDYGLDNKGTYSSSDKVYYLVSDPSYYVINRTIYIVMFSIADFVALAMLCAPIINHYIKKRKRQQKVANRNGESAIKN